VDHHHPDRPVLLLWRRKLGRLWLQQWLWLQWRLWLQQRLRLLMI